VDSLCVTYEDRCKNCLGRKKSISPIKGYEAAREAYVDTVVVATTCKDILDSIHVPIAWAAIIQNISLEQIMLRSKPVKALVAI